jgi:hypothetical protein
MAENRYQEDDEDDDFERVRLVDLPKHTQKFLQGLRKEEVEELNEAIQFMGKVRTVGTFGKWLIITAVSLFVATVTLGEHLVKFRGWFR